MPRWRRARFFDIGQTVETKQVLEALTALSQESRLAAFRLLVAAGPDGLSAGEIAESLGVVPATLSFHLKMLTHAGLLVSTREGRSIRYRVSFETMNGVVDFLTSNCCGGDPAKCFPAAQPKKKVARRR
jgi:DNA-binding transcriptional ArsR family regulator